MYERTGNCFITHENKSYLLSHLQSMSREGMGAEHAHKRRCVCNRVDIANDFNDTYTER